MHWLVFIPISLLVGCSAVAEVETPVERFQLENGLTVMLRPVPSAAHTSLVVLYNIGGDHDPGDKSGLAHAVEHVYVTAAAGKTKSRNIQEYMAAYPLGWNAQTGSRYTVIATVFDPQSHDVELQDAANRMHDLRVTDADLDREKPRIISELHNMYVGIPQLAARNRARELVSPSATGHRKGGLPEHVTKFSLDDIQSWWQKYYKPNNATLVLAGPFDTDEAKQAITRLFSSIRAGEKLPAVNPAGVPQLGETIRAKVKSNLPNAKPLICLAFAVPKVSSPEFPAFLMLAARLQAGADSLKTDPQHFPVQYAAVDDPEVLYVSSEVREGETADETVKRLDKFVSQTIAEKLTDEDRNHTQMVFAFPLATAEYPLKVLGSNIYGTAFTAGRRVQLNVDSDQLVSSIQNCRQSQVDRVRSEFFDVSKRAAVIVTPE